MIAFVSSVETPSIIPNSFYFCSVSLVGSSKREFAEYRLELQPGLKILGVARGGLLGLIFAGYVPLASQSPYPIKVFLWPLIDPILVTFGQICNFRDPNLKNTLLFICSTNIQVRLLTVNMKNCLTQKIRKCATPF